MARLQGDELPAPAWLACWAPGSPFTAPAPQPTARAAQTVALVGPSGGGKSSVVKLLQLFYVPSAGALRLDGRELGLYDPKWLKRHLGFVSQEPTLYARSIRRWGRLQGYRSQALASPRTWRLSSGRLQQSLCQLACSVCSVHTQE